MLQKTERKYGEKYRSGVNWRKVLENYRNSYNHANDWEIAVLELIANAIDAKASEIKIGFSKQSKEQENGAFYIKLFCEDNGKGMSYNEFLEYHNLGSLTKDKSTGTIGFAGIGAKLCLDLCEHVYTETGDGKEKLASKWWFASDSNEPVFVLEKPKNKLKKEHGTYVEIHGLKVNDFNFKNIKRLIIENYEYVIPPYGSIKIYLNNREIRAHKPDKAGFKFEKVARVKSIGKSLKISGELFFVDDAYIKSFEDKERAYIPGIDIVVCGKTVLRMEYFNLLHRIKPSKEIYVKGYVRCDELIEITKTSKDELNKKTKLWLHFLRITSEIFENWLRREGIFQEMPEIEESKVAKLLKKVGKDLNKAVSDFPELVREIPIMLTRSSSRKSKLRRFVREAENAKVISEIEIGDESRDKEAEEESSVSMENSEAEIQRKEEKKTGVRLKIALVRDEKSKDTIWFDPNLGAVAVNAAHPAFAIASRSFDSFITYISYIFFNYLLELQEAMDEERRKSYLWELYQRYLNEAVI